METKPILGLEVIIGALPAEEARRVELELPVVADVFRALEHCPCAILALASLLREANAQVGRQEAFHQVPGVAVLLVQAHDRQLKSRT
jgi:hypothetical protein